MVLGVFSTILVCVTNLRFFSLYMTIESHVRDTYHFFVMKSVCAICLVGLSLATQASAVFTPDDVMELRLTVNACLNEGDKSGNCPSVSRKPDGNGVPYGPIENWDVSRVTSMRNGMCRLFCFFCMSICLCLRVSLTQTFSTLSPNVVLPIALFFLPLFFLLPLVAVFRGKTNFNKDLSRWDVSQVTDMAYSKFLFVSSSL